MPIPQPPPTTPAARGSLAATVIELAAMTILCAAAGAWPPPDSNEACYLVRARHAADPDWLAGDFFLETPEAHRVFAWAFGPLAASLSLPAAAWVGRWLGWLAVAAGLRHALLGAVALPARRRWAWLLAAAAIYSLASRYADASGEWVIGGCEAKVFAWAGVLAAAGEVAAGRWATAWLACGVATAVHPLVGGWAAVASCLARCGSPGGLRPRWPGRAGWAAIVAGTGLGAVGVVPAALLSAGVAPETVAEAARIQVVQRLPHHLLPRTFPEAMVAAHLLAVLLLLGGWATLPRNERIDRLVALVLGSLGISAVGLLIAACEPFAPAVSYGLLRYYFFRLADGLVPLGLTVIAIAVASRPAAAGAGESFPRRSGLIAAGLIVAAAAVVDMLVQSGHWPLVSRDAVSRADRHVDAAAWREVCGWIRDHTPPDACVLTPQGAASFHWWADRREVVCWKNMPQDPESVVAWRDRIRECYAVPAADEERLVASTAVLGEDHLLRVAARYDATHLVAPRQAIESPLVVLRHPLDSLTRMYANDSYVVFQLPRPPEQAAGLTAGSPAAGPGASPPGGSAGRRSPRHAPSPRERPSRQP